MKILKRFLRLAMPTCSAIGVVVGALCLCAKYQSWKPVYWVIAAIIVPVILYLIFDKLECMGMSGFAGPVERFLGRVGAFGCFAIRLYWRHVRLAAYLWTTAFLAWLLVGMTAAFGLNKNKRKPPICAADSETEQFYGFLNGVTAPIQLAWEGLVLLWQVFVLVAVLFFERVSNLVAAHYIVSAVTVIAFYLTWLAANVRDL